MNKEVPIIGDVSQRKLLEAEKKCDAFHKEFIALQNKHRVVAISKFEYRYVPEAEEIANIEENE